MERTDSIGVKTHRNIWSPGTPNGIIRALIACGEAPLHCGVAIKEKSAMHGWIIIFALLFLLGLTSTLTGSPVDASVTPKLVTAMAGMLLFACIATRIVRRV